MTPEEIIDREKRRQEREAEALLLLLFLLARRHAVYAVRLGGDPYSAMAAPLLGSAALGLPGGLARLASILTAADFRGYRRTELLVPGDRFVYRPGTNYRQTASIALAQMLASLNRKVAAGLATARRGVSGAVAAVQAAFRLGGYTDWLRGPWRLRGAAETLVGTAYGTGQWAGYSRPGLPPLGLRYSSVLDERTTAICNAYHAVQLPREHPWWLLHWPLNHYGCRAVVLPIVGSYRLTINPPYVPPPMAGFGRAPFAAYAALTRPAA